METQRCQWRVEFEVYPKLDKFIEPHCIQQSTVVRGYRVHGRSSGRKPRSLFKYTISGRGIIETDGKRYEVPAGHGFLTNMTDSSISYYHAEYSNEPWVFVFISFDYAEEIIEEINAQFGYVYEISPESRLVKDLLGYSGRTGLKMLSPGQGNLMIQSVLSWLVDNAITKERDTGNKSLYARISEIVLSKLEDKLTLRDIAKRINMSKEHLCRVFKEETGMTVGEYIQREKIRHARSLLRDGLLNIKEISYRLDYSSPSQFNRQFKRVTGITPTEYRRQGIYFL